MKTLSLLVVMIVLGTLNTTAQTIDRPIAMDYHSGGNLYVLGAEGQVWGISASGTRMLMSSQAYGFRAADIVSARLNGQETIFISGFLGREGIIFQYSASSGQLLGKTPTPELAAGFDVDPGTQSPKNEHILYVASPVTNTVFSFRVETGQMIGQLASLKDAGSLGPLLFNRFHNSVFVADPLKGRVYEIGVNGERYSVIATGGNPTALALGDDGDLYVADAQNGKILRFMTNSSTQSYSPRVLTIPQLLSRLSGLSIGPSGTLFIADQEKGVFQLSSDGILSQTLRFANGNQNGCGNPVRLEPELPVRVGDSDIGLYLWGVSGGGSTDTVRLDVFRAQQVPWRPSIDKISHTKFNLFLGNLSRAQSNVLSANSYTIVNIKKNESISLKTDSGEINLKVIETHPVRVPNYAVLDICH